MPTQIAYKFSQINMERYEDVAYFMTIKLL